jgi:cytochrome c oxidase subunit 2
MASRSRFNRRLVLSVSLVLLALGSAACIGSKNPQDTLSPRGPAAADAKALFYPAFWIAVVVFVLVEGLLVFFVLRYRHRPGQDRLPKQVHGNTRAEIGWTIAPTLLLGILAIPTVATVYHLNPANHKDNNPLNVTVIGHQWWWEFDYTDLGVITANELHIPANRSILLTMNSVDVIHAFYVPELAGQIDVVPGHNNKMFLQADTPGTYLGQCTQFCGASHAFMRFRVMADPPGDFDAWVTNQKAGPVAPTGDTQAGAQAFANGACIGCHTIQGVSQGKVGPNLTHFGSRTTLAGGTLDNTAADVQKWIHDPQAVKPSAKMPNLHLSDQDIANLVAYLESLK